MKWQGRGEKNRNRKRKGFEGLAGNVCQNNNNCKVLTKGKL